MYRKTVHVLSVSCLVQIPKISLIEKIVSRITYKDSAHNLSENEGSLIIPNFFVNKSSHYTNEFFKCLPNSRALFDLICVL